MNLPGGQERKKKDRAGLSEKEKKVDEIMNLAEKMSPAELEEHLAATDYGTCDVSTVTPNFLETEMSFSEQTTMTENEAIIVDGTKFLLNHPSIVDFKKCIRIQEDISGVEGPCNIVVCFAAYLPDRSVGNYDVVMNNLFLYCVKILQDVATSNYVLIYFNTRMGSKAPRFSWLRRCYQVLDRSLRKNLKKLYLVNPSLWTRGLLFLMSPFISSKFMAKLHYAYTLDELSTQLPMVPFENLPKDAVSIQ